MMCVVVIHVLLMFQSLPNLKAQEKVQDMDIFYCVPLTLMVAWILYPLPMAKGASIGGGTMTLISMITAFINRKIISYL